MRLAHEEEGSRFAADRFVMRESVPRWNVAKNRRLYLETFHARHFVAMFSGGRNSTMFDRVRLCHYTDIGDWIRKWPSAGKRCASIMNPFGRSSIPFLWHSDEFKYVCALRWMLSGTEGDWGLTGKGINWSVG